MTRLSGEVPTSQDDSSGRSHGQNPHLHAARRLHRYLVHTHWTGEGVLGGPDPGIRFNARLGRFIKGYTPAVPWSDDLVYMQTQGYWILDNWLLHQLSGDAHHAALAVRTSESVLARQQPSGHWEYPNPEWRGRVATVEGAFAAIGLLETYENTGRDEFLGGAIRWHRYLREVIGFRPQASPDMLAVNYFAHNSGSSGGVPNNTTLVLWQAARLAQLTKDDRFRDECSALLNWLAHVQRPNGELPYSVGARGRVHFLCYQYNAFEFMDLAHYYRITGDHRAWAVMEGLATYLAGGLAGGAARYECSRQYPEVLYYTTAVAEALSQASELGLGDAGDLVDEAHRRTLRLQRSEGSFRFHSRRNYRWLSDRRSYPRYLAMMLHHLLLQGRRRQADST